MPRALLRVASMPKQLDSTEQTKKFGPVQASLCASPSQFYMLFSKCSPYRSLEQNRSSDQMPDLYLEVRENEVRGLTAEQSDVIQSRHVFTEDYFERISLESDRPVGIVLPANRQRDMIDMLNSEVQIELQGSENSRLAEGLVATDGRFNTWLAAPEDQEDWAESIIPDSHKSA